MVRLAKALVIAVSLGTLATCAFVLRLAQVTDHLYARSVKDPERIIPPGDNIVAPADGRILYVRPFRNGQVPIVIKRETPVPIESFLRMESPGLDGLAGDTASLARASRTSPKTGVIIGIYMNTFGVHINRAPISGRIADRQWFNGPQLDMTEFEKAQILGALIPGPDNVKKWLGLSLEQIVEDADYILESARETVVFEGVVRCYVVRIADFWVGRILNWTQTGDLINKGDRFGMITWGSQTDLVIETGNLEAIDIQVEPGDYVYGGETIIAQLKGTNP